MVQQVRGEFKTVIIKVIRTNAETFVTTIYYSL